MFMYKNNHLIFEYDISWTSTIFQNSICLFICLQAELDKFIVSDCHSSYGCLLAGGRVLAATPQYWLLPPPELLLLPELLFAQGVPSVARETKIFLQGKVDA